MSFSACINDDSEVLETLQENSEFSKARVWFESQDFRNQNSNLNANYATNNQFDYLEKIPDWSQVKKHTNAEGEKVLEIPLDFEKSMMPKHIIEMYRSRKTVPQQIAQNLLLIEKDDGTYKSLVLKIYSETDLMVKGKKAFFDKINYGKTPSDFTGEMIITDMNENIIRGWKIKEGKIISRFKSVYKQSIKNKTLGENHSLVCGFDEVDYCETTSGWFYDEEFGWDYGSMITCTQQTVITCIESDTDNDDGGGGINDEPGSGGGPNDGGGGDPDCYVEDPNFEDLWVPCDLVLEVDQIIKDPSFEGTKADCVYEKLLDLSGGFKNAIKKFDGEFPVAHLKFMIDHKLQNTTNAITRDGGDFMIEILFNGNTLDDRTILGLARTFIHEVIHAEMYRKVKSVNGSISVTDFPGIYDYYRRHIKNWQHEQMASHYRISIASMLQEFDTGIPLSSQ